MSCPLVGFRVKFLFPNLLLHGWLVPRGKNCHISSSYKEPVHIPAVPSHMACSWWFTDRTDSSIWAVWSLGLISYSNLTIFPEGLNIKLLRKSSHEGRKCAAQNAIVGHQASSSSLPPFNFRFRWIKKVFSLRSFFHASRLCSAL